MSTEKENRLGARQVEKLYFCGMSYFDALAHIKMWRNGRKEAA